jgi:hypothetical protein
MSTEERHSRDFFFKKKNYTIMLIGVGVSILGFILMIGGGSEDPAVFKGEELFSFQRITLAPILVLIGYGTVLFSIMKKPKD